MPRAPGRPIQYQSVEYIRIGSYRKKLKDHPDVEKELWRVFDTTPFEETLVTEHVSADGVLAFLDYPSYFDMLSQSLPVGREKILERLEADRMIAPDGAGKWNVTALGGILFAKNLDSFRSLARKAVRVIVYDGKNRLKTIREQVGKKGYASGFTGLIEFINTLVPRNEVVGQAQPYWA